MSFFKSLFGGGKSEKAAVSERIEHKGFAIEAAPFLDGGQYLLAGIISKDIGGVRKEKRFVRADRFGTAGEAASRAIDKGRQLVDEQGDRVFDS